jgi:hypothetical protein
MHIIHTYNLDFNFVSPDLIIFKKLTAGKQEIKHKTLHLKPSFYGKKVWDL